MDKQQTCRVGFYPTHFLIGVLALLASSVFAGVLSDAQKLYNEGNVTEALNQFNQVQHKDPNETTLLYNQANCHYKLDQTDLAVELFQKVLSQSNDPSLQEKAHFNLGNCSFRQATSQESPELQEALKQLQTAVKHYRQALTMNPNDAEAKHNIALACQLMAQIVGRIQQQEKQQQEDQEKKEDLAKKIHKLLERQNELIKNTDVTQQAQQFEMSDPNMIINFQQQLFARQIDLKGNTSAVQGEVQQMQAQQQQQTASSPAAPSVYETVNNEMIFSIDNQAQAADDLNTRKLPDAIANQTESAQHLQNALDALKQDQEKKQQEQQQEDQDKKKDSENKQDESKQNDSENQNDQDQNQKDQQDQQEQQEQSEQDQQDQPQQMQDQTDPEAEPLDMTAQQILDKEKERQQQKRRIILRGNQTVEKNW